MEIPLGSYWRLQKKYMLPFRKKIIALGALILVNILLQVIGPQIIGDYIDTVTTPSSGNLYTEVAILYILVSIVQQIALVASIYLAQDLAWRSTNSLRAELFNHSMNLDMTFHNEFRPGDMIERIDGDVTKLSNFFSQFTILILTNILIIIAILAVLFIENLFLGGAFILFVILSSVGIYRTQDIAFSLWRKAREASMKLFGTVEENLAATEDIRALGTRNNTMRKYFEDSRIVYDTQMKASVKTLFFIAVIYGLEAISLVLVFGIGVPLVDDGIFTIGTIVMLYLYAGLLMTPIIRILRQIQDLQLAGASI
ncbi:MAG: ABC transporter transmembrane domain-containing protein, partial [Candidatus Thorarchaeota archaeon]